MSGEAKPTTSEQRPARVAAGDRRLVRFLSQPLLLEEAGPPRALLQLLTILSFLIGGFLVWAAVTELRETASVTGQVMPAGSVRTVQHLEGGIIAEIYADEGEIVDPGRPLIRFEGAAADAELEQIRAREVALKLKAERLRAFVLGYDPDFSLGNERPDLVADQRVILEVQKQARSSQQAVLLSRIEQRQAELSSLHGQAKNLEVQAEIIREQVEMRRELVDRGLVSRVVYLETERAYTQALGDLASVQGEIQRTREALNEARNSLTELDASLGNDALDEIGALNAELAQVAEKKRELEDRNARLLVRAPVRGIVKGLVTRTIGSVVGPGELLMEIVPIEDTMVAEVRIDPGDIGHLRVGQDAEVKITTYDVARLGAIKGRLERISASTFQNERGEYYYKGRISLAQNHVGPDPSQNLVLPGMVVDADINTGAKSLLRYLLKPVFRSVDVAFSER